VRSVVGSKAASGVAQRIVSMLPAHRLFIEAFAGGAAVTLKKKPAEETVLIERDPETAAQLRATIEARALPTSIIVMEGDAISLYPNLQAMQQDACIYCDPPYLMETRKNQRRYYRYDWSDEDHCRFLRWVSLASCPVVISGYFSEMYASMLQGWRTLSFGAPTRGGRAVEWVWCNFSDELPLHDTRFVGDGFTDRQRIKRKAARWVKMLRAMPAAERAVIVKAVTDDASL
jgi:DNA adenine methylase